MGTGWTKLVAFDEFRGSLLSNADHILELQERRLCDLDERSAQDTADQISGLMARLRLGKSHTKMVVCSKALHHLLPNLVPPVDHEYTLWFFYAPTIKSYPIDHCFPEVFGKCAAIAAANRRYLRKRVRGCDDLSSNVFDTSETKLIDNAIVGYVLKELGKRPRGRRRNADVGTAG